MLFLVSADQQRSHQLTTTDYSELETLRTQASTATLGLALTLTLLVTGTPVSQLSRIRGSSTA